MPRSTTLTGGQWPQKAEDPPCPGGCTGEKWTAEDLPGLGMQIPFCLVLLLHGVPWHRHLTVPWSWAPLAPFCAILLF